MEEFCDPSELEIAAEILDKVPAHIALQDHVLPLRFEGDTLVVAVVEPMNFELIDKLRFILNREVRLVKSPRDSLSMALFRNYGRMPDSE